MRVSWLVSWCFEPSQPQRITSGLYDESTWAFCDWLHWRSMMRVPERSVTDFIEEAWWEYLTVLWLTSLKKHDESTWAFRNAAGGGRSALGKARAGRQVGESSVKIRELAVTGATWQHATNTFGKNNRTKSSNDNDERIGNNKIVTITKQQKFRENHHQQQQ